jgi:hypothetical protein
MVISAPSAVSFLTVSGVAATRVSCGRRSLRMAIFMERGGEESVGGAMLRRTLHSDVFFAKPVFRRAARAGFTGTMRAC